MESVEGSALAIPEAHTSRKSFQNHRVGDKTGRNCEYCGKPNHTQETCYKLHGKPQNGRLKKSSTPTANEAEAPSFSKEQLNHLLKLLQSYSAPNVPVGSIAQTCINLLALSVLQNISPWVIDSGVQTI